MRESKKRRLTSKGWKVGTTAEFLQLTAEESAYVEIKLQLAEKLRQQRLKHKMSQSQLAKLVRSSQSRVAKWRQPIQRSALTSWCGLFSLLDPAQPR